jgi:predicted RNase H-like HicB family nuclease
MNDLAQPRYRVALHRAKGCYFARVLELPGCIARGDTEVEAVENARHAIRFHLAMAHILAAERASVEVEIRA